VDYEVVLDQVAARPLAVIQQSLPVAEVPYRFADLLGLVWAYLRGNGIKSTRPQCHGLRGRRP
jgi:hypothetical protein